MAIIADTHRLISTLTERGFSAEQAETEKDVIEEIDLSNLVTKVDLRDEIRLFEVRFLKWLLPVLLGQVAAFALVVKWILGT